MRPIRTVIAIFLLTAAAVHPRAADDASIVPFTIRVENADLADLKARLARARFPDEIPGTEWTYGTSRAYLESLVRYWRDGFDWRAQERALNRFEQFTTTIDGVKLHFIHRRSKERNAMPLLVTHGWPGSIVEFSKVIEPLTDPVRHGGRAEDAFDIVAPSLPGFGFSDKPREAGFDPTRMAAIEAALMARLGYVRYGVQGGDWGSIISTRIALDAAPHVAGLHLNMCRSGPPPGGNPNDGLTAAESERLKRVEAWQNDETGYQRIQGTKPQTLGYGLNDSPAGLAAWIVEKFRAWSDCDGDVEKRFTKDELLTNIMFYWAPASVNSSVRLYCETMRSGKFPPTGFRVEVPTGCAIFPKEIIRPPRGWAEKMYNVARWTRFPAGGHFAAMEEPAALVEDIRAFFRPLRGSL